jgi:hypothetical protein
MDVEPGDLLVEKVGGANNTFTFDIVDDAEADVMLGVAFNAAGTTTSLNEGSYVISENAATGFTFAGWSMAVDGSCPEGPDETGADIPVEVVAGETVHLCIYNEADGEIATGSLFVQKVGGAGNAFSFDLDDDAGASVLTDVAFTGAGSVSSLEAGAYVLTEDPFGGFVFAGWALASAGVCPGAPTATNTDIDVTIVAGETVHLCIFNIADDGGNGGPTTGSLFVQKVGGEGNTFSFDIGDGAGGSVISNVIFSGTGSTTALSPGSFVVTEDAFSGYVYGGWALAVAGTCPSTPTSPDSGIPVDIVAGETVHLCIFNSAVSAETPPGSLLVVKVGGEDNTFTFDLTDDGGAAVFNDVTFTGGGSVLSLEGGAYVVTEDGFDGYVYSGWALASGGTCPATPTSPDADIDVTIIPGQTAHICIFNSAVSAGGPPPSVDTPPTQPTGLSPAPLAPQSGTGLLGTGGAFNAAHAAAGVGLVLAGAAIMAAAISRRRTL